MLQLRWARGLSAAVRTGLGQELRLEQTWEVLAWEIADLGCCPCGKYPWEVATWEKSFVKVPNIIYNNLDGNNIDIFLYRFNI